MLEPLVSLMSRFGACSARISGDRQTDRHTHTHRQTSTVTLAAHEHRGFVGAVRQDHVISNNCNRESMAFCRASEVGNKNCFNSHPTHD